MKHIISITTVCISLLLNACATAPIEDVRSDASIQATFEREKVKIYRIYQKSLRQAPDTETKTLFKITIGKEGNVVESLVIKSTLNNQVTSDINEVIKKMDFGKVREDKNILIYYPITWYPN
ncbi:MAG: AgmX/PglI C-terminal domain-containing protein [Gammaproteobacteria bacterium]|nr:AgmX/PglI C-terminal domain-containing protein [Gammaproteobacteria bacterium]